MIVLALVGELDGSPLDLTWYRLSEDGEEELFTHTVEVASFDRAYSVGESPGKLAAGPYRVEATLEGETRSVQFEVEGEKPEGEAAEASTAQAATSGPPAPGDSGVVAAPPAAAGGGGAGARIFMFPLDLQADTVEVGIQACCSFTLEVLGKVGFPGAPSDPGRTLTLEVPAEGILVSKSFNPA